MKIKLIIWDLDDTLWTGTLADGDDVTLIDNRAAAIRCLNQRGVISAVVSKNDPAVARAQLEAFGLWDEIVFPRISFSPKGEVVRQLIDDMQLRPVNVLFLDDNRLNLEEVKWAVPEINVADASLGSCDELLASLLAANEGVRKTRVQEYRILEQKAVDRSASGQSHEDFLRSCEIRVVTPHLTDNLDFADRIEELANRSNQLNYTKSRFKPGELTDLISQYSRRFRCWSVFASDRYGSHGLVGFMAIADNRNVLHFFFSCRIMHMGIEAWLLAKVKSLFPRLDAGGLPVQPHAADWIVEDEFGGPVRADILKLVARRSAAPPAVRFMLDCQSASVAHYAKLIDISETDLRPRVFWIRALRGKPALPSDMPRALVYGTFTEYTDGHSTSPKVDGIRGAWTNTAYRELAELFCQMVAASDRRLLVVLPPENGARYFKGGDEARHRFLEFNAIWREVAADYDQVDLLEMTPLNQNPADCIDGRHFDVPLLQRLGAAVGAWFSDQEAAEPNQEAVQCQRAAA